MAAPKGNRFWEMRSSHGRKPIFHDEGELWDAPNRDDVVYVDRVRCRVVAVVDDALVVVGLMGANV